MQTEEKGYVYFISEETYRRNGKLDIEFVKIGWTEKNPEKRLAALQTSNPRKLFILGTIKTNKRAEGFIHDEFEYARVRGEWFDFQEIRERLVKWIPIFSIYDFDNDCLAAHKFGIHKKNYKENKPHRSTLYELTENDVRDFKWFPIYGPEDMFNGCLLNPTTANKNHIDILGCLIQEGDVYYLINDSPDYYCKTKISESSLSIIKRIFEVFGFFEGIKFISEKNRNKYLNTSKQYLEESSKWIENANHSE